jgi:sigma-B regulation protein RsbU (phosphoserine phosphatase)
MRVLIADDVETNILILGTLLQNWGYDVVTAQDGLEAWNRVCKGDITFVISDLLMPNMDGFELCQRIRAAALPHYVYVILLTALHDKASLIKGMEAGADDFLSKPFNQNELQVRIRAGERVLQLEKTLRQRNAELGEAYTRIQDDLEAAAQMQQSLLPSAAVTLSGIQFDWVFRPSAIVGGDIFNFFPLDEQHVAFYHLDVAGHGIPSAMLSVTLSKVLTPIANQDSLLKHLLPEAPHYVIVPPADVVTALNERFQSTADSLMYFTMIYGIIDTSAQQITLTQAGHPSPAYIPHGGKARLLGDGGFPVGMLPNVPYESFTMQLRRGDRLVIYSDGVTECMNPQRELYTEERFLRHLEHTAPRPLREVMEQLEEGLCQWKGDITFDDDVSVLAFEVL